MRLHSYMSQRLKRCPWNVIIKYIICQQGEQNTGRSPGHLHVRLHLPTLSPPWWWLAPQYCTADSDPPRKAGCHQLLKTTSLIAHYKIKEIMWKYLQETINIYYYNCLISFQNGCGTAYKLDIDNKILFWICLRICVVRLSHEEYIIFQPIKVQRVETVLCLPFTLDYTPPLALF